MDEATLNRYIKILFCFRPSVVLVPLASPIPRTPSIPRRPLSLENPPNSRTPPNPGVPIYPEKSHLSLRTPTEPHYQLGPINLIFHRIPPPIPRQLTQSTEPHGRPHIPRDFPFCTGPLLSRETKPFPRHPTYFTKVGTPSVPNDPPFLKSIGYETLFLGACCLLWLFFTLSI